MAILSNLVRELEEENDRLTAELAEAKKALRDTTWQDHADHWQKRALKAERELAEAKKDTERLDFLDETNQSFFWPEDQSVRAAIDAGRGE
jgi:predicted RNase H-like nuclease (RuvC/YqgF family)